ncbi:MAG: Fur family transcriptional regulator [Candidatus Caenarcaniphilales bacterium]|nr:Fur family transcriptional regulator [Candidatus Caenarcaniphilales bacterium]
MSKTTTLQVQSGLTLQDIYERLRLQGSRITPQREYVLDVFFKTGQGCHLSVEDIFRILNKKNKINISLATVYRTVKTLYELGILREIDLAEGHKHYELASQDEDHHHHIVCLNCNNTIEFSSSEINELAMQIAKKYNIEVRDVELKIYGNCPDPHHHDLKHAHLALNHRH